MMDDRIGWHQRQQHPPLSDVEDDDYSFDEGTTLAAMDDVGPFRMGVDDASSSLSSGTTGIGTHMRSIYDYSRSQSRSRSRMSSRAGTRNGSGTGSGSGSGDRSTFGGSQLSASARPLTARSKAGYSSRSGGEQSQKNQMTAAANPMATPNASSVGPARDDPVEVANGMEGNIHRLLDESTLLLHRGDMLDALDKAKEAGKMERNLAKYREAQSLPSEDGHDLLLFGTWFQLALAYVKNSMYDEAIKTYTYLARQRKLPSSWKAQVNLGNILYRQSKYADAIKSYQMALDRIPPEERQVGFKVCGNVGNALIRLGRYRDASQSFESAMSASTPNYETAFNLLLCQLVKGDDEKTKQVFVKMLTLPLPCTGNDENEKQGREDDLHMELARRRKVADDLIINAARLVAPIVGSGDVWADGLNWAVETVREAEYEHLGYILEMELAVQHLRKMNIGQARKILKAFERKDEVQRASASTNLSFLCLLEGDTSGATDQASIAVTTNRYDAKALVNLGCSYYGQQDFERARDCFHEAVGVEAGCVQAMYNLGLTNLELRDYDGAVQAFEKFLQHVPNDPETLYWLSRIGPEQYAVMFESLHISM